ncbi:VOC family protein [Paenibacillus sp. Soil724D2]|uniref:VOC family protein n=1 Tax=Paenibacillus sp. (strain Soil724D2) TaxID=1736392 RepID=UPI0007148C2B|nr:VOC family protein [Paenibacillus sp. Soil724D2]KRE34316.1 glyoxalase [Paenibacillus sp. Soil724D2]
MKLNHLNLTVNDVKAASEFLEKYFELQIRNTRGNSFAVLFDDSGLVLTLMKGDQVSYPNTFHIGFIQESEDRVNEINQRLKDDGFKVEPPQRSHAWTFYVKAPGGFTVEVLS